jgi:hypothetical protein
MGPCLSQNEKNSSHSPAQTAPTQQVDLKPVTDPHSLKINKSIFITKNQGKFRENY